MLLGLFTHFVSNFLHLWLCRFVPKAGWFIRLSIYAGTQFEN